ncbi:MAG: hypothetical protein FWG50_02810 [Kiritimatiellaeota bacterium]|nr:hypothetical protein [Kiritimatiellota bacterium]
MPNAEIEPKILDQLSQRFSFGNAAFLLAIISAVLLMLVILNGMVHIGISHGIEEAILLFIACLSAIAFVSGAIAVWLDKRKWRGITGMIIAILILALLPALTSAL